MKCKFCTEVKSFFSLVRTFKILRKDLLGKCVPVQTNSFENILFVLDTVCKVSVCTTSHYCLFHSFYVNCCLL